MILQIIKNNKIQIIYNNMLLSAESILKNWMKMMMMTKM